jgi:coenzyme F420-0:L-glutamate ligase / coenzyme F420-1:gamma-L-glutamate ligase
MIGPVTLVPVPGIPAVHPGDDVAEIVVAALDAAGLVLEDGDLVVVASKIVSKAEGRVVELDAVVASPRAIELAEQVDKDPRLVEIILSEAAEVVRTAPGVLITRHRLGFVSANAAIDQSNVGPGLGGDVLLLPVDPDASARRLQAALSSFATVGVVVADTHGRAFRRGNVGVAIGLAGCPALRDDRGTTDLFGRVLEATFVPVADLVASAASLVGGEGAEGLPVVIVRGVPGATGEGSAADLVRLPGEDLFA